MHAFKIEYIWLDGYTPEPNLRSKTKIIPSDKQGLELDDIPKWNYDGSSTKQAEGNKSDCILVPVALYMDPQRQGGYLCMCEVMNSDGTPHETNQRARIKGNDEDLWFGFEQEYVFTKSGRPLGFPDVGEPKEQGEYYCGVGSSNVAGREIVETHMDVCLKAGITLTGINAEVLLGQWEYQLFAQGEKNAADDLWISRYLLHRVCEAYGVDVELHPKPLKGNWNGSGLHTNFSNERMREGDEGKNYFEAILKSLKERHSLHIENYGAFNEERLTGDHETQHMDKFTSGVSDRGASVRIPVNTAQDWKGYLEDRRPASNADPYKITKLISEGVKKAKVETIKQYI